MEYKEQIKSPKWQKKRLEILKRDEFTCQECGNKELTLHVHHKHYNKGAKIWEYEGWELTTLCENCHSKTHEKPNVKYTHPLQEELDSIMRIIIDKDQDTLMLIDSFLYHILQENTGNELLNIFLYMHARSAEDIILFKLKEAQQHIKLMEDIDDLKRILQENNITGNLPF
jgi:hypothetical protein